MIYKGRRMTKINTTSRRDFLKASTAGVGGAYVLSFFPSRVLGANGRLGVSIMGVNSRGHALAQDFAKNKNCEILYICDVDGRAAEKAAASVLEITGKRPRTIKDFRNSLEDKDVDALVIAAPDHWHAPASILAMDAGKNVYVEKPCGHNPREGEILISAQKRFGKIMQMGNQQRSSRHTMEALQQVREGLIGRVYLGKAFYANTRGPIGRGKAVEVPEWLDWDLWQGPAPHVAFRDNIVHYNWHWFWRWGTGESCNNGTHEVDVCRWFLDVDFPVKVTSTGGRYQYDDDWEFYDTQYIGWEFEGRKSIIWEGTSCNGHLIENRGRGAVVYGEKGSLVVDRNGYEFYDRDNVSIKKASSSEVNATMDVTGSEGDLTAGHIANFVEAVLSGEKPRSPIKDGHISVLLCHLGNIAQKMGRSLEIDPRNGRIVSDGEAMKMWGRDYEPGWDKIMK